MRFFTYSNLAVLLLLASDWHASPSSMSAGAKSPRGTAPSATHRASSRVSGGSSSSRVSSSRPGARKQPSSANRRRTTSRYDEDGADDGVDEEDFVMDDDLGFPNEEDEEGDEVEEEEDEDYEEEEEEEDFLRPTNMKKTRRQGSSGGGSQPRKSKSSTTDPRRIPPRSRPTRPRPRYEEEDEDDEYFQEEERRPRASRAGEPRGSSRGRRAPPPQRSSSRGGRVVHYSRQRPRPQQPSAFTRGLTALRESIPDPNSVKEAALGSFNVAKETTSRLSSNLYREIKGLTSSELEQVMLKATRPDDSPVKGKHVERLVGVTYQISARYDIYDAVLRKLWAKMTESDWRTTIKALYVLHRFASDGAPDHQAALKARLRELRRTRDAKRKEKYFNSKQLLAGETTPENMKFRSFMSRYAHYVLLRAQCFGGMFDEISTESSPPPSSKSSSKISKASRPITSTALRKENLEAAKLILKSGIACQLKEGEVTENTAIAVERVASDMIGLSTAVAIALNRALKHTNGLSNDSDPVVIQSWCEFYSQELLPQTRAMVKKTAPNLDAYGLFLPSRMGTTVSQEVLQRGLHAGDDAAATADTDSTLTTDPAAEEEAEEDDASEKVGVVASGESLSASPGAATKKDVENDVEVSTPKGKTDKVTDISGVVDDEDEPEEDAVAEKVEEDEYDEYDYEDEYYDDQEA